MSKQTLDPRHFFRDGTGTKPLRVGPILMLFLLSSFAVRAQNQSSTPVVASDLGQKNMSLVAASPADIKAVLVTDAGLMVELKRWVAKDATDHGQIISESDLTNDAIFDRLETDVKFRSVATRLLQLYGYLVPKVNPDSQLGKEQELLVQERVKWLAQDQEQRLAAARQPASQGLVPANGCRPQMATDCNVPPQPSPAPGPGLQNQPTAPPSRMVPNTPSLPQGNGGSLEQAQLLQNGGQSSADLSRSRFGPTYSSGQLSDNLSPTLFGPASVSGQFSGNLGENPFGVLTPQAGGSVPNQQLASLLGNGGTGNFQNLPANAGSLTGTNGFPAGVGGGTGNGANLPTGFSTPSAASPPRYQGQALLQPVELTRAPNPYGDIPSLYDMYLQATPHPTRPTRFGMEVFENGTRDSQLIPMDLPAGPDYVVGPGDGLAIDLWGGVSQRLYRTVDRQGRVSLPEVGPLLVSGKSLGDVQQSLQQVLRTQFRDVSADVSLARLRTIRVYVVGDVTNPGAYDISSLSTPLNALFAAGGPTPRGSLRIVKHYRGNQLVQVVDLYDLLLHGVKSGIKRLENGDTVLVPPIGPQVTVEGMVRRPAIYELKDEKDLASVLDLAGGLLPTAALHHIEVQRTVPHEGQTMVSLDIPDGEDASAATEKLASFKIREGEDASATTQKLASFKIHDGDQIRLFPIAPYNQNAVYLEGHVLRPGRYSYRPDMRVTDVISSYKDLLPEPATQYAEIIRLNAPDFHPSVEGFDLAEAMADPSHAPLLHPMDTPSPYGEMFVGRGPSRLRVRSA
jgi:protein involved in polysaccharide export with SLBB domain